MKEAIKKSEVYPWGSGWSLTVCEMPSTFLPYYYATTRLLHQPNSVHLTSNTFKKTFLFIKKKKESETFVCRIFIVNYPLINAEIVFL